VVTGARLNARPPLRVARAVVLACLATAVGAGSHLLTGGAVGGTGVACTLPSSRLRCRMWWQRRPTCTGLRLTPPTRRGALRDLPQATVFGIVLVTVAVGWLLPVLGVSLLVFLAGDAVAGLITRRRAARAV
jgi:uncharacterized iron-regulated membrane protein